LSPLLIVMPEILTDRIALVFSILRMRKALADPDRVRFNLPEPGPTMVTLSVIVERGEFSVMVWAELNSELKTMESAPAAPLASSTACQSAPAPLGAAVYKINVAAPRRSSNARTNKRLR